MLMLTARVNPALILSRWHVALMQLLTLNGILSYPLTYGAATHVLLGRAEWIGGMTPDRLFVFSIGYAATNAGLVLLEPAGGVGSRMLLTQLLPIGVGGLLVLFYVAWRRRMESSILAVWVTLACVVGATTVSSGLWMLEVRGILPSSTPRLVTILVTTLPIVALVWGEAMLAATLVGRRVTTASGQGDFPRAIAAAAGVPFLGRDLQLLLLVEQGSHDQAAELLEKLGDERPLPAHGHALLMEEEGRVESAWEALQANWEKHNEPVDVMTPALGLALGHDVLDLLEAMKAKRTRFESLLTGLDSGPSFAACRAWALAARGREQDARDALPVITDLPPLMATERDYLYGRALHALGDPEWRGFVERAAQGVGRTARLSERFLRVEERAQA